MEINKEPHCPVVEVDGFIEKGKQFDLEINLPEDNRNVIYGVIKDCFQDPVKDAVVKLVEIVYEHGKKERLPITHTFTNNEGEFVFGPLCPGKEYAIDIFVSKVKHIHMKAKSHHEGKCLKGKKEFDHICNEKPMEINQEKPE